MEVVMPRRFSGCAQCSCYCRSTVILICSHLWIKLPVKVIN